MTASIIASQHFPSATDVLVARALRDHGGRIVYSCEIDSTPRAEEDCAGPTIARTRARCGACGDRGHIATRCNGPGQPPRPTYREMRGKR